MEQSKLLAESRIAKGKGGSRKLRSSGRVPGIYYFGGEVTKPFSVDRHEIEVLVSKHPRLITLSIDDEQDLECIIRDIQADPVTGTILHLDLMGVSSEETLTTEISIHLKGTAIGVKEGGILEHLCNSVEISCLPRDIPEALEIDVSDMNMGDTIHLSSISIPGVTFLTDPETAIATVVMLRPEVSEVDKGTEEEIETEELEEEEEG